jgi:hypothetical protein
MRNLNYFVQFVLCFHCEKPFTAVSPDRIQCPYCGQSDTSQFGPLFSSSVRNLMEMLESVYSQKEEWKNHAVLITGLTIFEALLSEVFQSYMDHRKLPWLLERPVIQHVPWPEKLDFLIEYAHLEEQGERLKTRLKEIYELRVQFLHGKAQRLHQNLYEEMYELIAQMLPLFAELYFQLNLKPFFYQQVREETRPLRRGSESHIAPVPK